MNTLSPKQLVNAIVTSYNYNRSDAHVLRLIKNVLTRANGWNYPTIPYNSDEFRDVREDADIFYGILVNCYGDYGTSPRHGWISPENEKDVIRALEDELDFELQDTKVLMDMRAEEYSAEELKELKDLIFDLEADKPDLEKSFERYRDRVKKYMEDCKR